MKNLKAWSWADIISLYKVYGGMIATINDFDSRIHFPQPNIMFDDTTNLFLIYFWQRVKRIDAQIAILDKEIARRNNLIGVVG